VLLLLCRIFSGTLRPGNEVQGLQQAGFARRFTIRLLALCAAQLLLVWCAVAAVLLPLCRIFSGTLRPGDEVRRLQQAGLHTSTTAVYFYAYLSCGPLCGATPFCCGCRFVYFNHGRTTDATGALREFTISACTCITHVPLLLPPGAGAG
jgi:hypothetical protein